MKEAAAFLCVLSLLFVASRSSSSGEALEYKADITEGISIRGMVRDPAGSPVGNVRVRVVQGKLEREAVSDGKGTFQVQGLRRGAASITFEAAGFEPLVQKEMEVSEGMVLSVVLPQRGKSGWWMVWLLLPGLLGLGLAALKDWLECPRPRGGPALEARDNGPLSGPSQETEASPSVLGNRFAIAFFSALVWLATLALVALWSALGSSGVNELYLFDPELSFEFFVPILGFLGALIYVLDLFRRGREDIPKGTEFGMRLIMGPYVAMIMVMLLGKDLELVDLTSPVGRGALAFFSGLVVVAALQRLIESGQERLGQWRQRSRYEPSEIAKAFGLSQQDDQRLGHVGLRFLLQLEEHTQDELTSMAKEAGLDPKLICGLKRRYGQQQGKARLDAVREALQGCMGEPLMRRLKEKGIHTLEEFAMLSEDSVEAIASDEPRMDGEFLRELLQHSRRFCLDKLQLHEGAIQWNKGGA